MKFNLYPIQKANAIVEPNGHPTQYFLNWLTLLFQLLHSTMGQGFSGTITTAKLTSGGTTGTITFVNGVVTAQTAAT